MSPDNEKGRPRQGDPFSSNSSEIHSTPSTRQKPAPTHVIAEAVEVIGGTGRQRTLLLYRCLLCGHQHVCHGRGQVPPVVERPAACKRGRVALHVAGAEAAA